MSDYGPRCTCRETDEECRLHLWPAGAILLIGTGLCLLCDQPLDEHAELVRDQPACPSQERKAA